MPKTLFLYRIFHVIEIKGYMWKGDKEKMESVVQYNPHIQITILNKKDIFRLLPNRVEVAPLTLNQDDICAGSNPASATINVSVA